MKHIQIKLLLALILTLGFKSFSQISIFNSLPLVNQSNLNSTQLELFLKVKNQNIYKSINFISINDITTVADTGTLFFSLPLVCENNILFTASYVDYKSSKDFTWIGKYFNENDTGFQYANFTLMKNNDRYIGHISIEDRSFEIFDLTGGIQLICESDLMKFKGNDCLTSGGELKISATQQEVGPCNTGKTKVLILYTPAAQATQPDIIGTSNLAVSQLNQIWLNSLVNNPIDIVDILPLNFVESGIIDTDIVVLRNNIQVQNLRNQKKAEIVILLTGGDAYNGTFGIVKEISCSFDNAYGIVDVKYATTGRYTFAHEFTHLFGGHHDNDAAYYNAKGYIFKTAGFKKRRTLMVAGPNLGSDNLRIEHISNPGVQFLGKATGDNSHYVAFDVISNIQSIGSFYPDPTNNPYSFDVFFHKTNCLSALPGDWFCNVSVCNTLGQLNYKWLTSDDGFNWIDNGYPNSYFVSIQAMPWVHFIKCEIRNSSNVLLYSLNKTLFGGMGCFGSAQKLAKQDTSNSRNTEGSFKPSLYPNPNNGEFMIDFNVEMEGLSTINITDVSGRLIETHENISINNGKIEHFNTINTLSTGVYFIQITTIQSSYYTKLIINN